MNPLLALIKLTWKAAFRYRLFWVLAILLAAAALGLPKVVQHDDTANGFVQIVLTYTLSAVTALLGMASLWLACGTLARDIEDCQMQMVAVKPVPRWKIWLGKWLGIMSLNATLLVLAGSFIYGVLQWRANELPPEQLTKLRQEVLVARASLKEPKEDLAPLVQKNFIAWRKENPQPLTPQETKFIRQQIEEALKAPNQVVPPALARAWTLDARGLKEKLGDNPIYVRAKFYVPEARAAPTIIGAWRFGPIEAPRLPEMQMSMAPETFYEFAVPAAAIGDDGRLQINFVNRNNLMVVFLLDDGLEVLYREAGFGVNFIRGLVIIWLWLGLLAAIGLAAASFLSFPVAAFFSLAMMVIMLFSGTMASSVEEGTVMGRDHEGGRQEKSLADQVLLPAFRGLLTVINLAKSFSPIDSLSTGRSITWAMLGQAFLQITVLLSGAFALFGAVVFTRRELATAQGTS
jgi:hypothetical protein